MIQGLNDLCRFLLQYAEIEGHTLFSEVSRHDGDLDLPVVAVEVFASTVEIPKPVSP